MGDRWGNYFGTCKYCGGVLLMLFAAIAGVLVSAVAIMPLLTLAGLVEFGSHRLHRNR